MFSISLKKISLTHTINVVLLYCLDGNVGASSFTYKPYQVLISRNTINKKDTKHTVHSLRQWSKVLGVNDETRDKDFRLNKTSIELKECKNHLGRSTWQQMLKLCK